MTHEDPLVFAHGFKKYEKVKRFDHKDEIDGILFTGELYVFEKLDGANASVWLNNGKVYVGTKNRIIASMDLETQHKQMSEFRGLPEYIFSNPGIIKFLIDYPEYRLCGEWLVSHTVAYPQEFYGKFYVFDVEDNIGYMHYDDYRPLFHCYKSIEYLIPIYILDNPDLEDLKAVLGHTDFGARPQGEGIVVKNYGFKNRYGRSVYAKMVTKDFKEVQKPKKVKKGEKSPVEARIAEKYITFERVVKIVRKIETEKHLMVNMEDLGRVLGMVYHDLITEDMWAVLKSFNSPTVDFRKLRRAVIDITKQHFKIILMGDLGSYTKE